MSAQALQEGGGGGGVGWGGQVGSRKPLKPEEGQAEFRGEIPGPPGIPVPGFPQSLQGALGALSVSQKIPQN